MHRSIAIVLVVVLLVGGWFFVSPLFIDRAVDEDFSLLLSDGQLDMQAITAMPAEKQRAMMNEIMEAAAAAPDRAAAEDMPSSAPTVIASGEFVDADAIHKGSGQAIVYGLGDGRHVVRFENFRTTNGPALVVYLSKHPAPARASDVTERGFISLGKLKGNIGNQNYTVPPGTDIGEYNSVVIWCELFDVLFSPAALNRGLDVGD